MQRNQNIYNSYNMATNFFHIRNLVAEQLEEIAYCVKREVSIDELTAENLEKRAIEDADTISIYITQSYEFKATWNNPSEEDDFHQLIHTINAAQFIDFDLLESCDEQDSINWDKLDEEIHSIIFE